MADGTQATVRAGRIRATATQRHPIPASAFASGQIGVIKIFPFHLADVQVANSVGRQVGHFHLQSVLAGLQIWADCNLIRNTPENPNVAAIYFHARGFTNPAQIKNPIIGGSADGPK